DEGLGVRVVVGALDLFDDLVGRYRSPTTVRDPASLARDRPFDGDLHSIITVFDPRAESFHRSPKPRTGRRADGCTRECSLAVRITHTAVRGGARIKGSFAAWSAMRTQILWIEAATACANRPANWIIRCGSRFGRAVRLGSSRQYDSTRSPSTLSKSLSPVMTGSP